MERAMRTPRLSMNTSLKNARIFDDDAWDEADRPIIKKEIDQDPEESTETHLPVSNKLQEIEIKQELKDEPDDTFEEDCDDTFEEGALDKQFKPSNDNSREEGELEDSLCQTNNELQLKPKIKCGTPSPPPAPIITSLDLKAPVDRMFDESPYNKQLFNSLNIKEETPLKGDNELPSRKTLKSAKRTVFNRHSPYKKMESDSCQQRVPVKGRLGPKVNFKDEDEGNNRRFRNKRDQEMESDPIVLARREKQIEYGKNTLGYENYIQTVPKSERKLDDPQTPPKYGKYSRRGWEGLVKQWRIRLHRFDPPDATD